MFKHLKNYLEKEKTNMNDSLLLVKCITLLYRESLVLDKTENSQDLVRTVLERIKLPEVSLGMDHNREKLIALKDTALSMCSNPIDHIYVKEDLLQTLKMNCGDDNMLYQVFSGGIEKDMDDGSLKRTILNIKKQLNDNFRDSHVIEIINKAAYQTKFQRDKIKSIKDFVSGLVTELEPYQIEANRKDPGVISSIDLGDDKGLNELFESAVESDKGIGGFVTGWQDLNRMLQGMLRRGETWIIPALQHKYKTGFTLTLFKQLAIYNKPVLLTPGKKPLLLRISFEDELHNNIRFLYQNLYENEHNGEMPDLKNTSIGEMARTVRDKMQVNGFHVKMMRVNPSEWTYKDIQNTILEFEANGYEVQLLMLDYLYKVPTTGCTQGPAGTDIVDMFDRLRNFTSSRKITLVTPHQISTEGKQLVRDGHSDFVKKIAGGGYYEGSKRIDQVVDGEIYIHIEKLNNMAYLTVQRGKHRIPDVIPDAHMYFVLPFPKKGSILDDLDKPKISMSKVGGNVEGGNDEVPFFQFDDRQK